MGAWQHRLIVLNGEEGVCLLCGPVAVTLRSMGGQRVPRCSNAVRQQRGTKAATKARRDAAPPGPSRTGEPGYRSRSHGLSPKEAREYCEGKTCAICGSADRLNVDHDHSTRELRGVLCRQCNLALGHFKDSTERLRAAVVYLEGW